MRKIQPQIQHGAEFVQLSVLPFDQLVPFKDWLSVEDIFITEDDMGLSNECVHYDLYEFWYDTVKEESQLQELAIF